MSRKFAQLENGIVTRVIECEDPAWPAARLGGTWVETRVGDPVERYAGVGHGYDALHERKFAPPWRAPEKPDDAPREGDIVFREGKIWTAKESGVMEPPSKGDKWTDEKVVPRNPVNPDLNGNGPR